MISVRVRTTSDGSDPLAGFDQAGDTRAKVYLLQVKTNSSALDDALYTIAHPEAPDATPGGATHAEVVAAIRGISATRSEFADLANELADAYEQEYCPQA